MHVGPPPRGSDLAARGMAADAESPRVFEAWKGSNVSVVDLCPQTFIDASVQLDWWNGCDLLIGQIRF